MSKLINSFKKKSFRIGGYSFLISLILIAIIVVANVFLNAVPSGYTKIDTTSNSMYTLTEQTEKIVKDIDEDITIYFVASAGSEDLNLQNLVEKYVSVNSRIKLKYVDPAVDPTFADRYADSMEESSLVVESEKRFKVIQNSDTTSVKYSDEELQNYYIYHITPTGTKYFVGESEITSALLYVANDNLPVIYVLNGHGEGTFSSRMTGYFDDDNIVCKDLSILTEGKIPEDASAVAIISPSMDISDSEKEIISEYLDNGGKLILFSGYTSGELANLDSITESFGIVKHEGLVVESNQGYYYSGAPYYLLPELCSSEITNALPSTNIRVLVPYAGGLEKSETMPENKTYTSLLSTSDGAYIKKIDENTRTVEYAEGDLQGKFDVGCLANDSSTGAEIIWFTSDGIIDDKADSVVSGGNSYYFLTVLKTVLDSPDSVSIAAKSMMTESLTITAQWTAILSVATVFVIPAGIIVSGLIIWTRRRKAK